MHDVFKIHTIISEEIRANGTAEMNQHWDELCQKGRGKDVNKTDEKNLILALAVTFPREWESRYAEESRTYSKTKGRGEKGLWKYEVQMKDKYKELWPVLKSNGTFDMDEDKNNIPMWRDSERHDWKNEELKDQAKISQGAKLDKAMTRQLGESLAGRMGPSHLSLPGRSFVPSGSAGSGGYPRAKILLANIFMRMQKTVSKMHESKFMSSR